MKHSYRLSLIALALTASVVPRADAANEAEERAKRQLALLQKKLDTLQQGFSEQEKALRDANKRNLDLQRELNSTRTVMRWIGANPAALQQIGNSPEVAQGDAPAAAVKPESPAAVATAPAAEPAASAEPAAPAGEPVVAATTNKSQPTTAPAESIRNLPLRPAPERKPVVEEASDWQAMLGDPLYLGGGAAVLLGSGAWLWSRRRRKSGTPVFEDSLLAHNPPTKNIVIGSTGGAVIDTTLAMNSMFKEEDLAAVALDPSTIDPVAEAEVYLAYGRDSQAEEILQDALSKMPDRQDVRLKLMEIYSARGDLRHFEATLTEMQSTGINKEESIWQRVEQLCAGFGPKNPLIHEAEELPSVAPVAPAVAAKAAEPEPESAAVDFPLNLDVPVAATELRQPDTIEMALVGGAAEPVAAVQLDVAESTAIERGLDLLLPDVDLDVSESADKNEAISLDVTEAEELVTPPVSELTESEPVPLVTRINPDTLLNFDFEFDASPAAAPANLAEPDLVEQSVEAAPISLDFGGISLDLDTQTAEAGVKDAPAEIELTMDDIDNADEDPIDIKISLARAYMDMGDRDSANEILQEVLDEGNATQGKLAREMLEDMRSAA